MADDMFPSSNRTGQRDHTNFFMSGKRIADRFSPAKQHVQDACREDIFCQLSQLQRGQRRDLRGLITTQFPAASAGASFQAAIING